MIRTVLFKRTTVFWPVSYKFITYPIVYRRPGVVGAELPIQALVLSPRSGIGSRPHSESDKRCIDSFSKLSLSGLRMQLRAGGIGIV